MIHSIPYILDNGALPIPCFFGFPEYTPDDYFDLIIPADLSISVGDTVYMTDMVRGKNDYSLVVSKIVERREAKGDWSSQSVHKNPHYIRFISK